MLEQQQRQPLRLGVNIDHVATLRQQRGTPYPDVIKAAHLAVASGADLITVHLREDRRHIQTEDVIKLRRSLKCPLNLEMALTEEMLDFACQQQPAWVCLVPEKRAELTTEGGLDAVSIEPQLKQGCDRLRQAGCKVSLFIDPDKEQLDCAKRLSVNAIELHTGTYADSQGIEQKTELNRLSNAAAYGAKLGLQVHAGHGLNLSNLKPIIALPEIEELNIGHALIADALFIGLASAVSNMCIAMQRD